MGEANSWKTIHVPESLPHLLVRYDLGDAGYDIYMTDLSRIWVERLDRAAIVDRANDNGCTIEPNEDDQYRILLAKIKSSLGGDDGTSLSFKSKPDGQRLDIRIMAPLPSPLPDLQWTLHLDRMTDDYIGPELVVPLMFQANRLYGQVQSLIDEIRTKDRIISKLTDRLETSGNDLTTVFPGISNAKISRKRAQRPQLARYVKGLADFQEDDWRAQQTSVDTSKDLTGDDIDSIFTHAPQNESTERIIDSQDAWWRRLDDAPVAVRSRRVTADSEHLSDPTAVGSQQGAKLTGSTDPAMSETDFETQSTPPHLRHRQGRPESDRDRNQHLQSESEVANDDSTEEEEDDDDDLDAPPKAFPSSQSQAAAPISIPGTSSKLGTFGGGKKAVKQKISDGPEQAQTEPSLRTEPKTKLGTLGGTSKQRPTEDKPMIEAENDAQGRFPGKLNGTDSQAETSSAHAGGSPRKGMSANKNKLGTIGGKRGSQPTTPSTGAPPKSEVKVEKDDEADEEDSQDRATRKRDQLKRELEEKAKAPVKKKRRF